VTERVLELRDVDAGYGSLRVVRGVSLHVSAGEVVALLGPNGAGKTTTLSTAVGLLRPLAGEIVVLGEPVRPGRPHVVARRGVGFVPEDRALFSSLTVQENLRLGGRTPGDATGALELFPRLRELLPRKAGLLSGGEQQMLAIARALVARPRLLIVDELSLGLAPVVVEQVMPVMSQIAAETGCGVLLVDQHVRLALDVADRAYVLSHGDLVAEGDANRLAADPHLMESSYLGVAALADDEARDAGLRA
jgi:branched-chain amino acid transport system ATP-binding protein